MRTSTTRCCRLSCAALVLAVAAPLAAQQEEHDPTDHTHGLHFTHPLIAESISPDTKLRLDFLNRRPEAGDDERELEAEGEYAFHRSFSIEIGIPYDLTESAVGETHLTFKFANHAFEDSGFLLGYGLALGLPTGSGHGHEAGADPGPGDTDADPGGEEETYEIEPFLNGGFKRGAWETVAWAVFSIPTSHVLQEEGETVLRGNASALYHASDWLQGLLEADGRTGLSDRPDEETVLNLSPGIRILPRGPGALALGLSLSLPLTGDRDFDTGLRLSAFYHF